MNEAERQAWERLAQRPCRTCRGGKKVWASVKWDDDPLPCPDCQVDSQPTGLALPGLTRLGWKVMGLPEGVRVRVLRQGPELLVAARDAIGDHEYTRTLGYHHYCLLDGSGRHFSSPDELVVLRMALEAAVEAKV